MSRKPIDVAKLATHAFTRMATWLKPRTVFIAEGSGDIGLVVDAFHAWCAAHSGTVCELALSSHWIVPCVPPAGADSMTERELRRYAERQLVHYLEDSREPAGARWAMAVSDRPDVVLACAAPRELIDRLKRAATAHRVSIRRIFPWWLSAASPSAESTRSTLVEPGIATVLQFTQGRLHRVTTDFDADLADVSSTPSAEHEEVILWRSGEPMPAVCDDAATTAVIKTGLSSRRAVDLDLLGTPPRAWWGSWILFLVAVACALVEVHRQDGLWAAQAREQAMLDRVQASRARVRQPIKPASAPIGENFTVDSKTLEAAADMVSVLQHPWAEVFAGVEAASGHVSMLSLQHDASQAVVDIDVAVPNDDAAWGFAESMAAQTRRFKSATLLTRQSLDVPTGALIGRARVQAVLTAPESVPREAAR